MEAVKKAILDENFESLTQLLTAKQQPAFCNRVLRFALKEERDIVNNARLIQLIVNHGGADVNGYCKSGKSLLTIATCHGTLEMVEFLIQRGADVNKCNKNGESELELAVLRDRTDVVKCLLEHGANVHQGNRRYPLARAAEKNNVEMVKALLEHGADINHNRSNSLLAIVIKAEYDGMIKFMLNNGAEKNVRLLSHSLVSDRLETVKILLDHGCDPNWNDGSFTMLSQVIQRNKREIVELMLDYGGRINQVVSGCYQNYFSSALSRRSKSKGIVKLLIDRGIDVNWEEFGHIGLDIATYSLYNTDFSIMKMFVKRIAVLKSQGLFISEKNLNFVKNDEKLCAFEKKCEREIELLKSEKFDDSNLTCYDVLIITTDLCKIADLARNENIVRVVKSNNFVKKFPIYGDLIVEYFDKGISRNQDFELVKRFFNYLSTRKTNKLPRLPLTYVSELYNYLHKYDVDKLRNL